MTDGQLLLTVFGLFYLAECLHWLPLRSVIFSTWAIRRYWTSGNPSPHVAANGSGLAFGWPLPPLGSFFVSEPWPVIPSENGITIGEGQNNYGTPLAWSALEVKLDQRTVTLAPGFEVLCCSQRAAEELTTFLQSTAVLSLNKRKNAIEAWWRSTLSLPQAQAAKRKFQLAAWSLRMPCNAVFILSFLWVPLLYWQFGTESWRLWVGVGSLYVMTVLVAFTWRSVARRCFPKRKASRWGEALHIALMPMHAIRALDLISVESMAGLHPLVVAAAVLPREDLTSLASRTLREWKYKPATDPLHEVVPIVLPRLEACCKRLKLSLDGLVAPPARQGSAASFCPRCHAQFTRAEATCEQCGGLATHAWPPV